MKDMIDALFNYCDSVTGAESGDDLRIAQDALSDALNIVTLTICSKHNRENGKIQDAISTENRAERHQERLFEIYCKLGEQNALQEEAEQPLEEDDDPANRPGAMPFQTE